MIWLTPEYKPPYFLPFFTWTNAKLFPFGHPIGDLVTMLAARQAIYIAVLSDKEIFSSCRHVYIGYVRHEIKTGYINMYSSRML
jgi:hypothetical protein